MSATADRLQPRSPGANGLLEWIATWARVYSDAVARIARVGVIVSIAVCGGTVAVQAFSVYVFGVEIYTGLDEVAAYAFLWVIWMGVSLAIRRGEVTVITFVRDRGPVWLQRSVRTFSGISIALLLGYCLYYSTRYAFDRNTLVGRTANLGIPQVYGVIAMTVGYYFISMHYLATVAEGAQRLVEQGRASLKTIISSLAGAVVIGAAVLVVAWAILAAGGSPLLALGVIFVALTFAGNPIIFMLSIVGIISVSGIAGLEFYPSPDVLFPFRTTQTAMGLSGFSELTVVLMFLVVAEVMNVSGMSLRLIAFASTLLGHLRGGMAYVCQITSALLSGVSGSATADAAIMTPLLVPAMEKEGYPKDVAAAVVSGASIKGPIGPISIMFILYATLVPSVVLNDLLLSGILAETLLLLLPVGGGLHRRAPPRILQTTTIRGSSSGGAGGSVGAPGDVDTGDHPWRHPARGVHCVAVRRHRRRRRRNLRDVLVRVVGTGGPAEGADPGRDGDGDRDAARRRLRDSLQGTSEQRVR